MFCIGTLKSLSRTTIFAEPIFWASKLKVTSPEEDSSETSTEPIAFTVEDSTITSKYPQSKGISVKFKVPSFVWRLLFVYSVLFEHVIEDTVNGELYSSLLFLK
jgi:hypothetical protein